VSRSGEKIQHRFNNLRSIIFLVFAVSAASASPTTTHQDIILAANQPPAESPIAISCSVDNPADSLNSPLAELGREIFQPPASLAGFKNTQGTYAKPLPAVPAAFFMVLSGFLFVSAVKDRKLWLTALAGLFWAGQIGIQAIPQLALRLGCRNHSKQHKAELSYPYCPEDVSCLRSNIDGTGYIGLLHHLAGIPDFGVNTHLASSITFSRDLHKFYGNERSHSNKNKFHPSFAIIIEQCSLNSLLACLALRAKQFICFTPAFIFDSRPRGPPILTQCETLS